jgi:hypothetical protein
MKKIFSVVSILLCFVTSYAQDTKPTKQETMDWIGNKFGELLASPRKFISNKDGILTYKNSTGITVYLNFNKVTSYKFRDYYGGGICDYGCNNIQLIGKNLVKYSTTIPADDTFKEFEGLKENFKDDYEMVLDGIDEVKELRYRLEKAIRALVDYNTSKSAKEAY